MRTNDSSNNVAVDVVDAVDDEIDAISEIVVVVVVDVVDVVALVVEEFSCCDVSNRFSFSSSSC